MRKKLIQINTVCNNSVGQIMHDIQQEAEQQGYDTFSFVGRRKIYTDLKCEKFGNAISFWLHVALNTLFDCQGFGSGLTTKRLIKRLRQEKPDIIHLHNLHGYYLNLPTLFQYLRMEFKGELFWTFHDCWPFTGHCPYFVMAKCDRWKTGCYACPQKTSYPVSFFRDASLINYKKKKNMFTSFKNMTILAPSEWMSGLIKDSYFKECPVHIVGNGIDTNKFSPCIDMEKRKRVLEKYDIPTDRKILLGVASIWENRKGLRIFIDLSHRIGYDEYIIVLVGLNRHQLNTLPRNIIGIRRTDDKSDLAALYAAAHIFINPSMEESFSLVTVEAMACGTPVIALDNSAVKELVDVDCGLILHENSVKEYLKAIKLIEIRDLSRDRIAQKALKHDKSIMTKKVLELYEAAACGKNR